MTSSTLATVMLNAAQALGLLSVAGVLTGLIRWPVAARRDLLFAFIVFLVGTAVAQAPVQIGGVSGWGPDLVSLSAAGRCIQVLGAVLFIRASLLDEFPPWAWKVVVLVVAAVTFAV